MSSRPAIAPLTPADQTEIIHALPKRGPAGSTHQAYLAVQGRRITVNSVLRPIADDPEASFAAVAARRAEAGTGRLLPVLATGCHDNCHWIAYEYGAATPLASEGWRRWHVPAALELVTHVAHALDDAASHDVLAYEFLPASVFIDPRIGPLLGDFGSAREAFGSPPFEYEQGHGSPFVPPEVATFQLAGPRSGVYAAGALLYALLAGGPPQPERVTESRPDLPDDINLVLARAMARDSLERYSTAVEFCESARRALAEQLQAEPPQPSPPVTPARPAPERERAPAPAPRDFDPLLVPALETRPLEDFQPPERRFARELRVAVALGAVALAAFAGLQLGKSDPPPSTSGPEIVGGGLSVTLPRGWSPGVPRGDVRLAAYPSADWFSGLSVRLGAQDAPTGDRSDPVRLGPIDMWRDRGSEPGVVTYTAPTTAGTLVVSCEATSAAAPGTLQLCERAISTLRLSGAKPLPLSGVADEPGIRAAVTRLRRNRSAGRAQLARAQSADARRKAATNLARAYDQAARGLARVPERGGAAAAARRAASAYRRLAAAAGADSSRPWNTAAKSVRRADAELAKRLRAG